MYRFDGLNSFFIRNYLTSVRIRQFSVNAARNARIDKILIANRGEIACRVSRTAKRLGIRTVAVYSDADKNAMHVEAADEAHCIGPAPSGQSYLREDKILAVAKQAKCQAIHPGYGFLSENAEFAEDCQRANLIFIGPPASAIRDMGIKSTSKAIMSKAGVPIVEGYHGEDQSNETLLSQAKSIGFPLMIKAVRGGGGKGMRIASRESEFLEAVESARTESQKAFGDSAVLLERYVVDPRHVEVQIFADKHGNVVHLFERDCSIQRRHQKVIEEAPAPGISKDRRAELGAAAVRAAKAVGYVGAGTVEFLMDRYTHKFHFMEMNTRLQVEHPITEAITGTDLVEWQLKVAAGEKLPLAQEEIRQSGHAFEARIYAEDPKGGFLPGAGPLLHLTAPATSDDVRVETGVRQSDQVSIHYDPMIAKLVVRGNDRNEALNKLVAKLCEYDIAGLETNVEFIKAVCRHDKFQNGDVHTGFIEEHHESLFPKIQVPSRILAEGSLALILLEEMESLRSALRTRDTLDPFATETGLRLNHALRRRFTFKYQDEEFVVDVEYGEPEVYCMRVNKVGAWRRVSGTLTRKNNTLELSPEIDGIKSKARVVKIRNELHLFTKDRAWRLTIPRPKYADAPKGVESTGAAVSPMPGVVDKIFVKKGDNVKKGDSLLVIVAMKMEHVIRASSDGVIGDILCAVGDNIGKDKLLVKLEDIPGTD